jgi:hypothetical protein
LEAEAGNAVIRPKVRRVLSAKEVFMAKVCGEKRRKGVNRTIDAGPIVPAVG